jgi:hypothetical protein
MLEQEALDLRGIRVEPADDEHVLLAADDAQAAGLGELAEVAGVEPTVGVDRVRGGLRVVEVPLHDAVTAHQHLAVVGQADLDAIAGGADRGGDVLERVAGPRQRRRAALGQPVAGRERLER